MKKTAVFAFAFIAVLMVGAFLVLNSTTVPNEADFDQTATPTPPPINVEITDFAYVGVWHGTRLGGMLDLFTLTYTNLGVTAAENLTVTLSTHKINETEPTPTPEYNPYYFLDEDINGEIYQLESLNASETKTFERSYLDVGFLKSEPFNLTVTLKSKDIILDQATITIPLTYLR